MLSALQVKHFFVRMYALSSKTVIIDEVHAYDTYMSRIIIRLLEWLGAMHVPVILLSATLPSSRRMQPGPAYLRFVRPPVQAAAAPQTSYPRIPGRLLRMWVTFHSGGSSTARTVQVEWVNGHIPQENESYALGELLREELVDGGAASSSAIPCVALRQSTLPSNPISRAQRPMGT